MRKSFLVVASLMLAGCNFASKHVTPALSTPTEFPPEVSPQGSVAAADIAWKDFFLDERLRELIAQTLENNRDLRIAVFTGSSGPNNCRSWADLRA
jgi:outer membrane protein, multidrug efflux system